MHTLLKDIRYGIRMLARTPGFTLVAVLSLTLGIGVNTTVFSLLDAVILRSLPVQNPEQMVNIATREAGGVVRKAGELGHSAASDDRGCHRGVVAVALLDVAPEVGFDVKDHDRALRAGALEEELQILVIGGHRRRVPVCRGRSLPGGDPQQGGDERRHLRCTGDGQ